MFNDEFYPTPASVIRKMLAPWYNERLSFYSLEDKLILDPSAGKGDILDYITEKTKSSKSSNCYAIEINRDLTFILNEKGYKVIDYDFLSYNGDTMFDLIVMNPPFSNGDEHLLKAWEIMESGDIVCILNAETIKNPYSERRQLLAKIINDNNGSVEFIGEAFVDAERTTNVEACIVRLTKVSELGSFDFHFTNTMTEKDFELDEEMINNLPQTIDVIGNMMIQFDKSKQAYINYVKAKRELMFYLNPIYKDGIEFVDKLQGTDKKRYNKFCETVRLDMWKTTISQMGMDRYMTSDVYKNFQQFIKEQGLVQFTKENVRDLILMLLQNSGNILNNAVVDVFDLFTKYHDENRCHVEGWKTNDSWKVNRKVILPNWIKYGEYMDAHSLKSSGDKFKTSYNKYSQFTDIDKVMCYISGKTYENINRLDDALDKCFSKLGYIKTGDKFDNNGESEFFLFKFWKKGTMHIEFKDEQLWNEFNMRACSGKNWLPPEEEKKWRNKNNTSETKKEKTNQYKQVVLVDFNS